MEIIPLDNLLLIVFSIIHGKNTNRDSLCVSSLPLNETVGCFMQHVSIKPILVNEECNIHLLCCGNTCVFSKKKGGTY